MIFYFKIGKNVAFGAKIVEVKKPETQVKSKKPVKQAESRELEKLKLKGSDDTSNRSVTRCIIFTYGGFGHGR